MINRKPMNKKGFFLMIIVVLVLFIAAIILLMMWQKKAVDDFAPVIDFVKQYGAWIVGGVLVFLFLPQVRAILNFILGMFGVKV
jgi:hypothetical protein